MATIRVLSKQLANQIAAGEVVERPSSVVKELLENAVDAGADSILCEIRGAGKLLVRVRDNGRGIVRDELPLALAPHATSKIYSVDDLSAITTLGFRGEALASIASVSKLVLTSKTAEEENAYSVSVEGPEQNPSIAPAAHPVGTTVDVSELFFNTPARRRFLKSDRTELAKIKDIFVRVALAHPEVGFELISDGKALYRVSKACDESSRLKRAAVLLGSEFSHQGIRVVCEDPNLKIDGMLLPPVALEASVSERIYLFLNGRPIADRVVTHALKEGFYEVLGRTLPIRCVIYISIDPAAVDVNVHPRKDEVRFHETSLVHDLIADSIVYALRHNGVSPQDGAVSELDAAPLNAASDPQPALGKTAESAPQSEPYRFNESELPVFPNGQNAVLDISKVYDRGAPHIAKASSVRAQESFSARGGAYTPDSPRSYGSLSERGADLKRNVSMYNQAVASSNLGLNATTHLEEEKSASVHYDNGISLMDMVDSQSALIKAQGRYYLVNLRRVQARGQALSYKKAVQRNQVECLKLLIPYHLNVSDKDLLRDLKKCAFSLKKCGFLLKISTNRIEIQEIPQILKGSNLASFALDLFSEILLFAGAIEQGECADTIADIVGANALCGTNLPSASDIIGSLESLNDLLSLKDASVELNLKQLAINLESRHEK